MSSAATKRTPVRRAKQKHGFLYRSVGDALRRRLNEGDFKGGSPLPSLRKLARQFNVSTITVGRALRTLEQEGHLSCLLGVGVFVAPAVPAGAATGQTTIAFVTLDIESGLTAQVAQCIEAAGRERGWAMQLLSARGDHQLEACNLSHLAKSGLSGAVILPADSIENLEAIFQLKINGFPIVLVDRAIRGLKVDVVESDHEKGAYLATEYLLKKGHRRVLMVAPKPALNLAPAWLRGYEQALINHGVEPLHGWKVWIDDTIAAQGRCEGKHWWGGRAAVLSALRETEPPVAVFAHNAYSGWGVFEACRELGLKVPDDVSIICFDDADFTRAMTPPMTVIHPRTDEIGRTAVELLERRLSGNTLFEPEHILLDVELIERESVVSLTSLDRHATGDAAVARVPLLQKAPDYEAATCA